MTEHEAALKRLREKRDAYLHVFGKDGQRTFEQQLVLTDLETLTKHHDTAIVKDGSGRYDGGLTAYKAGLQDVMKRIYLRINWSEHEFSSRNPTDTSSPSTDPSTTADDE